MSEAEMLVRVVAPFFVAGLVMRGDRCVEAAPILKACNVLGLDRATLSAFFRSYGWRAVVLGNSTVESPFHKGVCCRFDSGPSNHSEVAQLGERATVTRVVAGSKPALGAKGERG
jgi:hypothetical protein